MRVSDPRSVLFISSEEHQQRPFPHDGFERKDVDYESVAGCDPNGYHLK